MTGCHEGGPVLVCHGVVASTDDLNRCFKFRGASVGELPLQAGHEVLSERHGNLKDDSIVLSVGLARHANALHDSLEWLGVTLALGAGGREQSLHFLGVGRHLAIVGLKDLLELIGGVLFGLGDALGLEGVLAEEGAEEVSFKHFIKVIIIDTPKIY